MANTTFSGPIRSENGFIGITKNSSTGAITENITFGNKGEVVTPVVLADGDITIVTTTHGGRINLVPDGGQDNTYTLPAPEAGVAFRFIMVVELLMQTDAIFVTPGNTNFYLGNVSHLDTNADNAAVYPNGSSNKFTKIYCCNF